MELTFKQLKKSYGDINALNTLDLTLSPGIYGLLGPNGAGKSTLMKLICMLIEPSDGSIYFDGKDIRSDKKAFLKQIGYMPQHTCLYDEFRVQEYLFYIGALKGMNKKDVKENSERLLKRVELYDVRNHKIATLSGGMKQRLMFAQAMIDDPKIVILDEPTAGLDPKKRIQMRNMISEYAQDKIIIIATHVVSDVEFISNEIILLKKGNLIAQNSAQALIEEIDGKIYEIEVEGRIEDIEAKYHVNSVYQRQGKVYAKILLEEEGAREMGGVKVYPDLEDVYLSYFDER